jgi:hypothetical protein
MSIYTMDSKTANSNTDIKTTFRKNIPTSDSTPDSIKYKVLEDHIDNFGKIKWKNTVSYVTYKRTYARRTDKNDINSPIEEFPQTIYRVIKACNDQLGMNLTPQEQCEYFDIFANFKALPAGRFLWQLGTKTVDKHGLLSLQNCAFTKVENFESFCWVFDCLMLGSGTGYNIQRKYVDKLPAPVLVEVNRNDVKDADFIVPDSREGWIELLRHLLRAHFTRDLYPSKKFSYSCFCLRSKGAAIKDFGGTASGPEYLCEGISDINKLINGRAAKGLKLRPIDCLDIMNIIARTVISGNVRRSAQIAIGDIDDMDFLSAKRWDKGNIPNWRCFSNNSVVCNDIKDLPDEFWEGYTGNGECYGLINLELSKKIGRTGETQYPDPDVAGYNPSLRKGTRVLTDQGVFEIQDLQNTYFKVRNSDGNWRLARCWKSGINKPLYELTLANGKKYWSTAEHKWPIFHNKRKKRNVVTKVSGLPSIKELTTISKGYPVDAGLPDSSVDAKLPDSSVDAGLPDSSVDAGLPDSSVDAGLPDSSVDAGLPLQVDGQTVDIKAIAKSSATPVLMRMATPDLMRGDKLPYYRTNTLCMPKNTNCTYTDGVCMAMLYCSPSQFVIKNEIKSNQYVWCLPKFAKNTYLPILISWILSIENTVVSVKNQKSENGGDYIIITAQSDGIMSYISQCGPAKFQTVENNTYGLPESIWSDSEDFRKGFVDGCFSLVGGIDEDKGIAYITNKSETFIRDLWDLLGFYGISSSVKTDLKTDTGIKILPMVIFETTMFNNVFSITNDAKRNILNNLPSFDISGLGVVEIIGCVKTELEEDVWDVTVYDDTHTFSLSHCFTGNCGEQSLADKETCCLQEIFLPNIKSREELDKVAKMVYRIAKHSMALPCHQKTTEAVVHKHMRMGIGITGVLQVPEKMDWLDATYKNLRVFDEKYSADHKFPPSIKLTTVKPSGCVTPMTQIVTDLGVETLDRMFINQGINLPDGDTVSDPVWYDVKNPIKVLDSNNKWRSITRFYDNGIKPVLSFKVDDKEVVCTPDHKFMIIRNNTEEWVKAKDIKKNDIIKSYTAN